MIIGLRREVGNRPHSRLVAAPSAMGINMGAKATAKAKANAQNIKKATKHTRASPMIVVDKAHDEDDTKKKRNLKRRDSEQQIEKI